MEWFDWSGMIGSAWSIFLVLAVAWAGLFVLDRVIARSKESVLGLADRWEGV